MSDLCYFLFSLYPPPLKALATAAKGVSVACTVTHHHCRPAQVVTRTRADERVASVTVTSQGATAKNDGHEEGCIGANPPTLIWQLACSPMSEFWWTIRVQGTYVCTDSRGERVADPRFRESPESPFPQRRQATGTSQVWKHGQPDRRVSSKPVLRVLRVISKSQQAT